MDESVLIDSILVSIKRLLGIEDGYDHFDPEIVMYINAIFQTLDELGVGKPNFKISSKADVWSDFLGESSKQLEAVKTYIYLRTRLMFDPPQNSFIVSSFDDQRKELEWRLLVQAES